MKSIAMPKATDPTHDDDPLADAIPARIRTLRTAVGVTAAELDRLTAFNAGTIGRLERGAQRIYASHLGRIATATGVDVGWFFRADDEIPDNGIAYADGGMADADVSMALELQRLVDAYARITDPALKLDVFELVKTLADNPDA